MGEIKNIKEIYGRLGDELSRKIFENRLLFSLTGNYEFICDMIFSAFPKFKNFLHEHDSIILYGAGAGGRQLLNLCADKIIAFCDSDETKHLTCISGRKIISPEELVEKNNGSDIGIVISIADDNSKLEVKNKLLKFVFSENKIFAWNTDPAEKVIEYFDNNIIPFTLYGCQNSEEVFIDAGSFDFASSFEFIKWCDGNYKKIIAFEPNPKQYPVCVENAKDISNAVIYSYGLWNENIELSFNNSSFSSGGACVSGDSENTVKIKAIKIDDILKGEKATFIKMDIEGAELNALKGAEQTILKYRPKLAICLYHKPDDIWEIPAYILSLHNNYKLYIRHYSLWHSETVLYAV